MTLTEKTVKWVKGVAYGLEAAFLVVFIILCVAVGHKNAKIKEYWEALKFQCEVTESLQRAVNDMAGMECIRVETSCIINNKGLVNVAQTNQISRSVSSYTKGEVLAALDSLRAVNKGK